MKKGIENTLWNMKECGCQEDIIREYEKLIESPHREEAVAMLEKMCIRDSAYTDTGRCPEHGAALWRICQAEG